MDKSEDFSQERLLQVYRETIDELYYFVSRRTGADRQLSEDVVQETYMRALRSWSGNGLPSEPIAWLKTVARNLVISHFRRTRPSSLQELEPSGSEATESPEKAAILNWALSKVREEQARLLEAFHFEGKRVKEIAAELEISERAVEGRLRRARSALRANLQEKGE